MKNNYYYEGANPTVDLILVSPENKVLMILRKETVDTCPSMWAIPGGFVDTNAKKHEVWQSGLETPEQAAFRELVEETGISAHLLDKSRLQAIGIYEGNQRDPRDNEVSWSRSNAFMYQMTEDERNIIATVRGIIGSDDKIDLDDSAGTKWFSFDELAQMKLAFDHNQILNDAYQKINSKTKKLKV